MPTWTRIKGATYLPENLVITAGGDPLDLSSLTAKIYIVNASDDTDIVANNVTTGITVHPTQTFTANATTDRLTCNGHGLKAGDQIIVSNSGGALPTGLSASTRYFPVEISPNAFKLAATPTDAPIDITAAGTGTHSFFVVGSLQVDLQSTWVDAVGVFEARLNFYSGSEFATVPFDKFGIRLEVLSPPGTWV